MKVIFAHSFEDIISVENLLEAWREFLLGKKQKKDVQVFQIRLMDNIFSLHRELSNHTWKHGGYQAFKINDPKPRDIHKATVRDRLLHHAIYRKLYPFFAKTFIADSYSCQLNKGTHRAVNRFREFAYKVGKNNTRTCWILKCDIRKFFASINHEILLGILKEYIQSKEILWLMEDVINSFNTKPGVGLPLGNLTSQLFVNIYMNKLDQFMKHRLKVKYYIRYADDFLIFSEDKIWLEKQISAIAEFLKESLGLELHPNKVSIETLASGVDFLGMNNFPYHKILRTKTKKRMLKKLQRKNKDLQDRIITAESFNQSLQSYLGMLKHCETYNLRRELILIFGVLREYD
jgi:retron-type reverse transcriptase